MSYLHWLPTEDVLHEYVFQCLDYESRIQLNQFFRREETRHDMYVKKISPKDIWGHELIVQIKLVKSQLNYLSDVTKPKRKRCKLMCEHLNNFRPNKRFFILFSYYSWRFLHTVVEKLLAILDPDDEVLKKASNVYRKKIRSVSEIVLKELLEYPFDFSVENLNKFGRKGTLTIFVSQPKSYVPK